jgi:putative inorganic carbon (hco3(-)) transporter
MGLLLSLLYLTLLLLSPADLFPELAVYRPNLVVLILSLAVAFFGLLNQRLDFRFPQHLLLLFFFGVVMVSWIFRGWMGGVVVALQAFGPIVAVYYLFAIAISASWKVRVTAAIVIVVAAYYAIRGILVSQFGIGPENALLRTYGELGGEMVMQGRIRGEGLFEDPNDLGQLFVVSIALSRLFFRGGFIKKVLLALVVGVLLYGCYLTRSRGTLVGLASLLFARMVSRGRVMAGVWLGGIGGVALTALNFASGRDISVQGGADRIMAWGDGFQMFKEHPLFGVGINGFMEINGLTAHNSFVLCISEQGLVGYFFWMAAICSTILLMLRFLTEYRADPNALEYYDELGALLMALTGWLVTGWFLSRTYSPLLFLLLGMIVAVMTRSVAWKESTGGRGDAPFSFRMSQWAPTTVGAMFTTIIGIYMLLRLRAFM